MKTETANLKGMDILGDGDCSSGQEILTAMLKRWRQKLVCCSIFAAIPAVLVSHISEARSDEVKRTEASVAGRVARSLEKLNIRGSNPALLKRQSEFRLPHQKGSFALLAPFAGKDDCPGFTIPEGTYTAAAPYTDSGDTTGANDTVRSLPYYYTYDAHGPDHVYSFTLTGRGSNPQIEVSTTSGTYRPLIYVLEGGLAGACPAGTGNSPNNILVMNDSRCKAGSNTAILSNNQLNFLPLNVPLHLFVDSAGNDSSGSGPYTIRIQDVTIAPPTACTNPIDCPEFFVRQHYSDFLQREPDIPGQGFWTDNITKCTDPSRRPAGQIESECIDKQKESTSAAFFLSPEFQYTGYYLYRFYKGSLTKNGVGRIPTYQEFRNEIWRLSSGIIQNNQLSAAAIEANKKRFADDFVKREEFRSLYDALSNVDYVERLFQTTGVNVSAQEKQTLVNGLNNRTETRASVLHKAVDGTVVIAEGNQQFTTSYGRAFYEKEFNSAFVLMEYFGYLHRDPDAAGYQHWLDKLNFYGNYLDAEMVKSFITSPEYRARFGQP
jgi:hypothetical protein